MRTLILTDNKYAYDLASKLNDLYGDIDIFQSPSGPLGDVPRLDVKRDPSSIAKAYSLVLSIHCKQLFPSELVSGTRCINVHPGFNPYNRGWYPQVFSLINGLPAGVTIHEIDEDLDHGPIIAQEEYIIQSWDTSGSIYSKIMEIEKDLVMRYFVDLREGSYTTFPAPNEGNINYKQDFDNLKQIDLNKEGRFRDFLNRLRALTHGEYRNAFFIDEAGKKIFVRVILEEE